MPINYRFGNTNAHGGVNKYAAIDGHGYRDWNVTDCYMSVSCAEYKSFIAAYTSGEGARYRARYAHAFGANRANYAWKRIVRYWRRKGVDIVSEQVGAERYRLIDQYAPNKRCAKKAAKRVAMSATFDLATRAGRKAARSAKWYDHGHAVNLYLIRG